MILKSLTLTAALILSLGCGRDDEAPNTYTSPELDYYAEAFEQAAISRGRYVDMSQVKIVFAEQFAEPSIMGKCFPERNEILISQGHWQHLDEATKKVLIFHELGHCVLHREHAFKKRSIMNPKIEGWSFQDHEDDLLDELFAN